MNIFVVISIVEGGGSRKEKNERIVPKFDQNLFEVAYDFLH